MARLEIGDVKGVRIWRDGAPQRDGGEGVIWGSDSPEGLAYAEYQRRRLAGERPAKVDPGYALGVFFSCVKRRHITKQIKLTVEGYRAALTQCVCRPTVDPKAIPIAELETPPPAPPAPLAPATPPPARPGKNSPCPCGSGRRRKDCRGPLTAPHPPAWYVDHDEAPPVIETPAKKRRREKAEREAARAIVIDRILDEIHAWDEERRKQRRATAKKTAAKKKATPRPKPAKKAAKKKATPKPKPAKKSTAKKKRR